jgi:hypothetical protein
MQLKRTRPSDISGAFLPHANFLCQPLKIGFKRVHIAVLEYIDHHDALVKPVTVFVKNVLAVCSFHVQEMLQAMASGFWADVS